MNTEKPKLERITMKKIFRFFLDIFNIESGLIYTAKNLMFRPGPTLKTYLYEDREKLVKPFRYLILSSTVMAFLTINYIGMQNTGFLDGIESGYEQAAKKDQKKDMASIEKVKNITTELSNGFAKYFNAFIAFSVPFYALAFLWFFHHPKLNYAEHLVLTSYLVAQQSLIGIVLFPLVKYTSVGMNIYIAITSIYMFYLYQQFFDYKFVSGFFRTLAAYLLGTIIYSLLLIAGIVSMIFINLSN